MWVEESAVVRLTITTTTRTTIDVHINSIFGGTRQNLKRTYHLMQGEGAGRRYICYFLPFYIFYFQFQRIFGWIIFLVWLAEDYPFDFWL